MCNFKNSNKFINLFTFVNYTALILWWNKCIKQILARITNLFYCHGEKWTHQSRPPKQYWSITHSRHCSLKISESSNITNEVSSYFKGARNDLFKHVKTVRFTFPFFLLWYQSFSECFVTPPFFFNPSYIVQSLFSEWLNTFLLLIV